MIRMSKNLVYRSKARPRSSVSAWISLFVVGSGFFGKNKVKFLISFFLACVV
ncbi:hypothetical protein MANES_02G016567v8 [Manihot esculenta]|uniref:Uncharacterized protein n=1 Tax=Manihot esculenta TaxID=3983 RepID=A0ACB7I3N7_MANES|nr:hypothetical protein MANES_02G016567v8 [Manihot esculenta]